MNIIDWIEKNAKEGANLDEAREIVKDLNPLENIKTKEDALSFIDRNSLFKAALDSETSRRVERHDEKFQAEKLPELLSQKEEELRKQLNPEETPEQKRIRELEEKLQQKDKAEQLNQRKLDLREKAKEYAEQKGVKYDVTRAEMFAELGDNAEKALLDSIDYIDSYSKSVLESTVKGTYQGKAPSAGTGEPGDINSQIQAAKKDGNLDKAASLAFQKAREQYKN